MITVLYLSIGIVETFKLMRPPGNVVLGNNQEGNGIIPMVELLVRSTVNTSPYLKFCAVVRISIRDIDAFICPNSLYD